MHDFSFIITNNNKSLPKFSHLIKYHLLYLTLINYSIHSLISLHYTYTPLSNDNLWIIHYWETFECWCWNSYVFKINYQLYFANLSVILLLFHSLFLYYILYHVISLFSCLFIFKHLRCALIVLFCFVPLLHFA